MKKTIFKIAIISILMVNYSCGNKATDKNKEKTSPKTEEHDHAENKLVLNDGKHWIANAETTTGVNNMIRIMNSFSDQNNVEAYALLTKNLKKEFTMIFQKCTMTGESHNQLHNFLVPIKDVFETLSSSDLKKCQDSFQKLNKHLGEYKKFFE
jgi:hypothetical protein